jgi:hypothetical protein
LGFVAGKEEEQMDGGDHGVQLRFVRDESVLVEKLDSADRVLILLAVAGGKSVEEVELREPDWITNDVLASARYSGDSCSKLGLL